MFIFDTVFAISEKVRFMEFHVRMSFKFELTSFVTNLILSLKPITFQSCQNALKCQASRFECILESYFLYFSTKHMLWVLKNRLSETVFEYPKHMFKLMGKKNSNFTPKIFA